MSAPRNHTIVAIDGPSGSGKSTISRRVAAQLGMAYLDTGAMYRAAAWWCVRDGIDLTDTGAVAQAVRELPLVMGTDPADPGVAVGGEDVSVVIRSTEISTVVSAVATNLEVRDELRRRQREIIDASRRESGIVAEGRDITTVVAPDADVRILLVASEEARLARRAREIHGADDSSALAATRDQVLRRDADDSTVSSFHRAADGVVTIDSSELTLEETVDAVRGLVEATRRSGR
ncbi:(d)CMP kinase [Pseudactinotalea suaedae]|uniref:(d)CMP kinase n=1 Tax=Pseudactinotalea suaedae TaxID=1524924 RepID=UPI0012E1E10B|nr:(d)CMP kinase [Pseudactinotalea suaedae]